MSILRVGESGSIWVIENGRTPYEVYVPNPRSLRRTYKNNFTLVETKVVTRGRPIREVCDNTRTGLMSCAWWRDSRISSATMIFRVFQEASTIGIANFLSLCLEQFLHGNVCRNCEWKVASRSDENDQIKSFSITGKQLRKKGSSCTSLDTCLVIDTM